MWAVTKWQGHQARHHGRQGRQRHRLSRPTPSFGFPLTAQAWDCGGLRKCYDCEHSNDDASRAAGSKLRSLARQPSSDDDSDLEISARSELTPRSLTRDRRGPCLQNLFALLAAGGSAQSLHLRTLRVATAAKDPSGSSVLNVARRFSRATSPPRVLYNSYTPPPSGHGHTHANKTATYTDRSKQLPKHHMACELMRSDHGCGSQYISKKTEGPSLRGSLR